MNIIDFLNNETIVASIIGAIIGSGLAHFFTVITERWKVTRQERKAIVAELAIICHEYIASLEELQAAKEECDQHALRTFKAQLTRLDGSLAAIQMRLWYVFPQRRVRAGLARLRSRRLETTQYLLSNTLKTKDADVAIQWFVKAVEELMEQATDASNIPTRDSARLVYIGLRKVTPEDMRLLSFQDEPPPWQFAVSFDFTQKVDLAGLEKAKQKLESQAATLRCKLHNRPAHILLYGRTTKNFDIQVDACCVEFIKIVEKAIHLHGGRKI
nr:MAG: hypothetical protein OI716_00645 [Candidatus Methanoperedens sp.]WAI00056.1 MAG: hypothetical protein OI720_00490 [Candidatus Methanoperedens sp.]